jgi:arylsulfatase A-like enzyme
MRIARYDEEIHFTDRKIGELLEFLEEKKWLDSTLVVVTGDHGEGLMDHGHMSHGVTIYEEAVKVPLIFHWPGQLPGGRVLSGPATLLDVAPTILDLVGLPSEHRSFRGTSLAASMRSGTPIDRNRKVFLQRRTYDSKKVAQGIPVEGEKYAVVEGDWKYIEALEGHTRELYNLKIDPDERRNVAADHPEKARALSEGIATWKRANTPDAPTASEESEEDLKKLEALGYVR